LNDLSILIAEADGELHAQDVGSGSQERGQHDEPLLSE
jgi:hypothetical protein